MNEKEIGHHDYLAIAAFIVAFLTLLATLLAVWIQLYAINKQLNQSAKISSAQYVLDLSNKLNSSQFTSIMNAI